MIRLKQRNIEHKHSSGQGRNVRVIVEQKLETGVYTKHKQLHIRLDQSHTLLLRTTMTVYPANVVAAKHPSTPYKTCFTHTPEFAQCSTTTTLVNSPRQYSLAFCSQGNLQKRPLNTSLMYNDTVRFLLTKTLTTLMQGLST